MSEHQQAGLHVSVAGGVENAPDNAKEVDAECFQIFTRSPRGGGVPEISDEQAEEYKRLCAEYGYESYVHTPYYVNFASKTERIRKGSINVVREELERASKIGARYVVTHMGSAKDFVQDETRKAKSAKQQLQVPQDALDLTVKGLKEVYDGDPELSARLLLEISAGAGAVVGNTFEDLKYLLDGIGRDDVHICLDTAHMFASGYDIRTQDAVEATMKEFDEIIGMDQFVLAHFNDSKVDIDERADRHEHMGDGYIGKEGLKACLAHPAFQNVNYILETKHDDGLADDIAFLKDNRA